MRRPFRIALLVAVAVCALAAPAQARDSNPCLDGVDTELLCPDIEMSQPFNMSLDTRTIKGRSLLRAANSVNSVGDGPVEVRGWRAWDSPTGRMRAVQRIHRFDGTRRTLHTGAGLIFKRIPGQGGYWKFDHPAEFLLIRLDRAGNIVGLARRGPKTAYCLRDLVNTFPGMFGSPTARVYPACNQNPATGNVTLGTSVGWSDVYPASYHEQWIDVTGLSGCFAYVHLADPGNRIYELDETNNAAARLVALPWKGASTRGCRMVAPAGARVPARARLTQDQYGSVARAIKRAATG